MERVDFCACCRMEYKNAGVTFCDESFATLWTSRHVYLETYYRVIVSTIYSEKITQVFDTVYCTQFKKFQAILTRTKRL